LICVLEYLVELLGVEYRDDGWVGKTQRRRGQISRKAGK
jgi:hypothetical protein